MNKSALPRIVILAALSGLLVRAPRPQTRAETPTSEPSVRSAWTKLNRLANTARPDDEASVLEAAGDLLRQLEERPDIVLDEARWRDRPTSESNALVLNDFAWKLLDRDRRYPRVALLVAQPACELAPDLYHILDTVAWAQLRNGQTNAAIGSFKRCLGKHPGDSISYLGLALAYARNGEGAAGWEALATAVKRRLPDYRSEEVIKALVALDVPDGNPHKQAVMAWQKTRRRVNRALSLDGDGDYAEVPDHNSLDLTTFTLEAWVRLRPHSNTYAWWTIVGKGEDSVTDHDNYILCLDRFERGRNNLAVRYEDANDVEVIAMAARPVTWGGWHHVAGVRNADGRLQLYVNGKPAGSALSKGRPSTGTSPLYIGAHLEALGSERSRPGSVHAPTAGLVDEVRVWNVARTLEEIQATMNTTLTGQEEGLVGYWNFDDGSARDWSSGAHHGALRGDARIVAVAFPRITAAARAVASTRAGTTRRTPLPGRRSPRRTIVSPPPRRVAKTPPAAWPGTFLKNREIRLLLVVLGIGGIALFVAVLCDTVRARKTAGSYSRLAADCGGMCDPGGWFGRPPPTVRFQHDGTAVLVDVHAAGRSSHKYFTQVHFYWPGPAARCEVYPENTVARISKLLMGMQDIEIGSPEFDRRYIVQGDSESAARNLLGSEVRMNIELLRQFLNNDDVYVSFTSRELLVKKKSFIRRYRTLGQFVDMAAALFDSVEQKAREGIEFVRAGSPAESACAVCQICGEVIESDAVFCRQCWTPHHRDCWQYYGECSTYGCLEKKYMRPESRGAEHARERMRR